ncbi:MAG: hypothetical protein ACF788_11670 [Novipirellula sp. JB048]
MPLFLPRRYRRPLRQIILARGSCCGDFSIAFFGGDLFSAGEFGGGCCESTTRTRSACDDCAVEGTRRP